MIRGQGKNICSLSKIIQKIKSLKFVKETESVSHSVVPDSLRPHGLQSTRLLCPWNVPGKNIGVGCHSLLQGIFLTQGSNPGLLHCRWILYRLSHQGYKYFTTIKKLKTKQNKTMRQQKCPLPWEALFKASLATGVNVFQPHWPHLLSRGPLLKAHLALALLTCEVSLLVSGVRGRAASGFRSHLEQTLGADVTTSPRAPGNAARGGL